MKLHQLLEALLERLHLVTGIGYTWVLDPGTKIYELVHLVGELCLVPLTVLLLFRAARHIIKGARRCFRAIAALLDRFGGDL